MFARASRVALFALALLALSVQSSVRLEGTVRPSESSSHHAGHHPGFVSAQTIADNIQSLQDRIKDPKNGPRLQPTIDGAKTPELIPDSVAYGHFIGITVSNGTERSERRREHFLADAGLDAAERATYISAVADAGARLNDVDEQRSRGGFDPAAVKRAEAAALSDAQTAMRRALSPAAMAKVDAYVRGHIKRHIRMYSGPMQ